MGRELSEIVRSLREEKGLTQEDLAKKCGYANYTSIAKIESGRPVSQKIIIKLANALDVSPVYLLGWEDNKSNDHDISNDHTEKGFKVPVLGYVAGGIPIEQITEILDYEELSIDMKCKGEFFGLKIKGNSMSPRISDGDVVIVRKQNNIENGEIAIIAVNGDEATCKKVNVLDNGIMLIPLNAAYEPIFYSLEEVNEKPVRILGKVVELRAKF